MRAATPEATKGQAGTERVREPVKAPEAVRSAVAEVQAGTGANSPVAQDAAPVANAVAAAREAD